MTGPPDRKNRVVGAAGHGYACHNRRKDVAMNFMPDLSKPDTAARDYSRIAKAIAFVVAERPRHPALEDVAKAVGLSPFHLQRLFKRWAGVSPKQLMGYLTLDHAKAVMRGSASVLDASLDVGLSGPSRLHDLFVTYEAMTPGEYKEQGRDIEIRHGVTDTPFGRALILSTARGVCGLEFLDGAIEEALARARAEWPLSKFVRDTLAAETLARQMFAAVPSRSLQLLLRGTNFQVQVWAALMRIPPSAIVAYGDIATSLGQPTASRAVGTALARNPVGYLVPCHRVLRSTGLFKNYRWGAERRHAMLAWEAARASR